MLGGKRHPRKHGQDSSIDHNPLAGNQDEVIALDANGYPVSSSRKPGVANGLATLDGAGKVPTSEIPDSIVDGLEYKGTWDANTNTPTLADGTGQKGWFYIVTVAGSQDLGSGVITFAIGDWAMHNGSQYEKILNSHAVSSVFARQGAVVATAGDYNAGQVTNTPAGNIAATDVQGAIDELDTEKEPAFSKNTAFNKNFGTGGSDVCVGNDARLSDDRTPLAHALAGAKHSVDVLANLISKLSDVTKFFTNNAGEINGETGKNPPVDADILLIEDSAATWAKKKLTLANLKAYLGIITPEKNSSTGESTTTAITYQSKLQLTFTPPSQGDYQLDFYSEFANEETKQISCKIDLDSGTVIAEQVKTVADTQANGNYEQFSGSLYVNLTAASHTFDLMWHGETSGKTAYIRRAYMIARRL